MPFVFWVSPSSVVTSVQRSLVVKYWASVHTSLFSELIRSHSFPSSSFIRSDSRPPIALLLSGPLSFGSRGLSPPRADIVHVIRCSWGLLLYQIAEVEGYYCTKLQKAGRRRTD